MLTRAPFRVGLIALALLAAKAPIAAQTGAELTRRLDEYVSAHVTAGDFSGVVLLAKDGKPVQLDDSICRFLTPCPEAWQPVTLHHLLTHTSGIRSHSSVPAWQARNMVPHTSEEVVGYIRELPLRSASGTRHAYNNSGYFLLGLVIEKVTGRKYEEVLKTRILAPIGMTDTGYDWPGTVIPKRASGYDGRGHTIRNTPAIDMHSVFASGAMYSTALDLLKWDQALYGETLLPAALKSTMWTPSLGIHGRGGCRHADRDRARRPRSHCDAGAIA